MTTNNFFPADYKIPVTESAYTKLQDGENNIRVLGSAVVGWEYWNTDNKPVRSKVAFKEMPEDIRIGKDGNPTKIKHFWAFVVWNYEQERVQILEITQKTIMSAIKALVDNSKWGDPKGYDISITKSGEGLETEYAVMPNPHSEAPEYDDIKINLQNLYTGENPFEAK